MTAPALTAIGLFFLFPAIAALVLSFTDFDIYALANLNNLRFIGLDNYQRLVTNPLFWQAMGNTMWFVVFGVPLVVIASLAAAMLVNAKTLQVARGVARGVVRAVRDDAGGDRGGVELPSPHALRADQLCAGRARHRAGRLARQSQDRAARDPAVRGVEELRLQHDHLPRRAAVGVARH